MTKCTCCKRKLDTNNKLYCGNCYDYLTNKLTMLDVAVIISHINHRDPKDKYAREICEYFVADNYMQGKATLGK